MAPTRSGHCTVFLSSELSDERPITSSDGNLQWHRPSPHSATSSPPDIRELQHLIERAVILSPGELLQVPLSEIRNGIQSATSCGSDQTLEEAERRFISWRR
jgi:hypothetical protein